MQNAIRTLLTVLAIGGGSIAAHATAPVVEWCNSCTPAQINNAVLTSGVPAGGVVYVADPVTGAYSAYDWYAEVDDSHNPPLHVKYVENNPGDPNVLKAVHSYIQFYQAVPVGWTKHESIQYTGPDPKANGYTVATFGQTQTNFNTWLNNNGSAAGNASQLLGISQQLLSATSVTPSQIETVTFPNGDTINAVQNPSCGCLNAFPDSARDSEGNPIPYVDSDGKLHNAGGQRHFSNTPKGQQDFTNYKNAISQMPIVLYLGPNQVGGGGSTGGGAQPEICTETPNSDGTTDVVCYKG